MNSSAGGPSLKVGTLNVHLWKTYGGYSAIKEKIEELDLDVVALTELLESKSLKKLAKSLGMNYAGSGNGVGLMSKFPLKECCAVLVDVGKRAWNNHIKKHGRMLSLPNELLAELTPNDKRNPGPRIVMATVEHPAGELHSVD